jgi:hypothetical protein
MRTGRGDESLKSRMAAMCPCLASDPAAMAGINATVLSVAVAVGAIYISSVYAALGG